MKYYSFKIEMSNGKRYVIKPVGGICGELHTDEGEYIDNKKNGISISKCKNNPVFIREYKNNLITKIILKYSCKNK